MAIPVSAQNDPPSDASLLATCVFCLKHTPMWTDLPDREESNQVACCVECGEKRNREEVPTNFQWRAFVMALTFRARDRKPYVGPWSDEKHIEIAKQGLCYRAACGSTANHAWKNTGMGTARYCTRCVRLLNDETGTALCIPDIDFALALPLA